MPTKSTRSPGATTSRMPLPAAAATSAAVGLRGADEIAARFFIRLELDQAFALRLFQQVGERAKAVVRLVEARLPALQRLLHHRAPDALVLAALGDERLQRFHDEVEGLLLLVLARGRRLAALFRRAALLLVRADEIVVIDELVAVSDEQIRARVLHADADHGFRVLAQLGNQGREVRVAADDDESVDVRLG